MIDDDELYQRLLGSAISYVSLRLRSESEIDVYLAKKIKKFGDDHHDLLLKIKERLQELGYVDDTKYVRTYIESVSRNHPVGKRMFMMKLRSRGVQKELIESILSEVPPDDGESEYDRAKRALERKMRTWRKLDEKKRKQKAYGFLLRRGFPSSMVFRVIDEVERKDYNTTIEEG